MKKMGIYVNFFLLGIFILFFIGCSKKQAAKNDAKNDIAFAVFTYTANLGNFDDYLEFGGDVQAVSSVDIYPDASGKLSSLPIKVGDFVNKNQVIAGVDPTRPGLTYSISPVKAPVTGTITSLPVSLGSTVAPSVSMGKISSTDELEVVMSVAERYISRIEKNQNAFLTFDAFANQTFSAYVARISPVLDTATRAMDVTLYFANDEKKIKAGMYARIKLITNSKESALVIPYTAIVSRQGNSFVFVLNDDNTVRKQSVQIGIRVDDRAEIVSGLSSGDEIVIRGQNLLDDGVTVNVISRQTNDEQATGGN